MVVSLILNILIVAMELFALAAMYFRWDFMGKAGELEGPGKRMFRYFTIDSNILLGLCSLIMAVAEIRVLSGTSASLPAWVYGVKLMGTTAVMLTFLVTVCFLVPQFEKPMSLFYNSNLFLHLIVPLLAAVSFVFTEPTDVLPFGAAAVGVLPTVLYGIYYVGQIFTHLADGKPDKKYDFYNFLGGKLRRAPIAIIAVLAVSFLLSLLLWWANRQGSPSR